MIEEVIVKAGFISSEELLSQKAAKYDENNPIKMAMDDQYGPSEESGGT